MRQRLVVLFSCLIVVAMFATACSSDDKDSESTSKKASSSSSKSGSKVSSSGSSSGAFQSKVKDVCDSIDQSVFDDVTDSSSKILTEGPEVFEEAVQKAEDEIDKIISKLEDIDPPSKYSDDWDTFIEDMSAIRDAYPQLADYITKLTNASKDMTSSDSSVRAQATQDLQDAQDQMQSLAEDLTQRGEEISSIAKKLDIGDTCDIDS